MNFLASREQLRASLIRWALVCVPLCVLLGVLSGLARRDLAQTLQAIQPALWVGLQDELINEALGVMILDEAHEPGRMWR